MKQRYFFCPKCGGVLAYKSYGDRDRLTCAGCQYIFYENPVVGVAVIVFDRDGRILLGKRNSSYRGLWCIPCGYVEYDEDVFDAAVREFKEETNLEVKINRVFTVQSNFHNPESHTVGIWFLAEVAGGQLEARADLDEVAYFDLSDPPPLAFPTDALVIEMLKNKQP
ncbi:NUDIX hydrolase [Pelotomaculum propionicicum]|mgnify:CR=1 FL=1|uniref:CTP pyrophosphohydrolase n=1 Tax=Pelotomaculum propionicicum TaxID=258475 RepID=A0A4Y7RXJ5_9FIRM|nr:NUDIX hydrolase [Pelotomaculum propionicicum]NLI12734.1 NUDIX hydrolase [Peptococcaceae bacterium]TEB13466.1 CTP pyrophosphohydrolase [Pelotomaculum propionicicum]